MDRSARPFLAWGALAILLIALALARPLDHDESQYVAAAMLSADGLLPYRDYGYFQTPLQPFAFAPVVWLADRWAWPALRIVNALLGALAIGAVFGAARSAGARTTIALACAGSFATCDILLFSIGTARNDALPAALFAGAVWLIVRAEQGNGSRRAAAIIGALLAAAAAAKISYALPALAYGLWAVFDRRHRPLWVAGGALPFAAFVGWAFAIAPEGFLFGVFDFPANAPIEYYTAQGKAWKLGYAAKAIDTLKFLALGPALLALGTVGVRRSGRRLGLLDALILAGLLAALLPSPTWRQYLLPALPPLFVRLAMLWEARPPGRIFRVAGIVFVVAGIAPSVAALAGTVRGVPMIEAMQQGAALRTAMDRAGIEGTVATLSPQFLPATGRLPDRRFAPGPFYFRSRTLIDPAAETRLGLISRARLNADNTPPAAILTGGEGAWTSGDPRLDGDLIRYARQRQYRALPIPGGRFTLYVRVCLKIRPQRIFKKTFRPR